MAKRESKSHRSWCFTWNNYNDDNVKHINTLFKNICKKYIFQEEKGKDGTPHLQGVVCLKQAKSFVTVKELIGKEVHLEVCKNFKNSWKYCCKEESRNGLIYSYPKMLNDGKLLDAKDILKDIRNQMMESDDEIVDTGFM